MKVIPGELQRRLVVVDVEERKLKKSGKKSKRVRWRVWKLKEKEIKKEFEQRVVELVDTSDGRSISTVGGPKTNDQIFFIYNQGRQWRSEKF